MNKLRTPDPAKRAHPPTDRDVDVLRYIAWTLEDNSRGPSLRDICEEFDFVSITQAVRAVDCLRRAGRLKRGPDGLELMDGAQ
jgi:hypothetical protein